MTPLPAGIHHHVLLRRQGGATQVARLLALAQHGQGLPVSLSCEVDEPGQPDTAFHGFLCPPHDLARLAPAGSLVHVHATLDWPGLLDAFASAGRSLCVTTHDCRLLTGGCAFPAFCGLESQGCPSPCPRAYPESGALWTAKRQLVARARPALVSPSAWLARQLRTAWPAAQVRVIPNGVDFPTDAPGKAQARAALGIPPAAAVVAFVAHGGDKAAYKGGDRFTPILEAVAAHVPGVLGVVAGGAEAGLAGGLMRLPYLDAAALATLMRAADVLAYPSQADNHPLVVLEAMAAGLPVAAYDVGGIGEQIAGGVHGLLAPVFDEAGLVRAVARLLTDKPLARTLALQARERQQAHFTAQRMHRDYLRLYRSLAG